MIKRIIIQWSLRSKSLQKLTVENPYEIGPSLTAQSSQLKAHGSQLMAHSPVRRKRLVLRKWET